MAVLARISRQAVWVQVLEYPEPYIPLWLCVLEPFGDRDSCALVAMDAADNKDAVPALRVPTGDSTDRSTKR